MDGKIYDLLCKINGESFKKSRFALSRDVRTFILEIFIDNGLYEEVVSSIGIEKLNAQLQDILDNLINMEERIESFKDSTDENLRKAYESLSSLEVMDAEDKKDDLIRKLISSKMSDREFSQKELEDRQKYSTLISEFKK